MIMGDNPANKMRKTYLLVRGQYSSPDESKEIQPNTPKFLPAMKTEADKNRLGLAKWLTDKENPFNSSSNREPLLANHFRPWII